MKYSSNSCSVGLVWFRMSWLMDSLSGVLDHLDLVRDSSWESCSFGVCSSGSLSLNFFLFGEVGGCG